MVFLYEDIEETYHPSGPHPVVEEIGGSQYWPAAHKSPGIVESQWYPWQTTVEEV